MSSAHAHPDPGSAARFHLSAMGQLRLATGDRELLSGRRKELALLAYIARHSRSVLREELAALLWGERTSAKARQSLRHALLQLRRALGDAIVVTAREVRIDPTALELDVVAIERDLANGLVRDALGRWRGELLADAEDAGGDTFRTWLEVEREGLRRRLSAACDQFVTSALRTRRTTDAVAVASEWVRALPFDEQAHRRLIEALAAARRHDEALAQHAMFVTRSRSDLGREPSQSFLDLARHLDVGTRQLPSIPGSVAILTPDLIGREAALAEMIVAWYAARAGQVAGVVIVGDEGMGKTRLCQELLRWVASEEQSYVLLHAQAQNGDREQAGSVVRRLLTPLAEAPGLLGAAPDALQTVARFVPALRNTITLPQTPAEPDPMASLDSLASAATEVIDAVAAESPIMIVVDDLASADAGSQQLTAMLVSRLRASVMVAITIRPDQQPESLLASALRNRPGVRQLRLEPLTAAQADALIASMVALPQDKRRRLTERLHAEAQGNPLYISELVFTLADSGVLSLDDSGVWQVNTELLEQQLPLPKGMKAALERRLATLTAEETSCLEALSLATEEMAQEDIVRSTGLAADRVAVALDELIARRLLRHVASPEGRQPRYAIVHGAIQRVVRGRVGARDRDRDRRPATNAWWRAGRRPSWAWAAGLMAAVGIGLSIGLGMRGPTAATLGRPVIAIVGIDVTTPDSGTAWLADGLPQMIASKLARSMEVDVVPPVQTRHVRLRAGHNDETRLAAIDRLDVAKRLRATIAVHGELSRSADSTLVLSVTARTVEDGRLLRSGVFTGADPLALADETAAHLLGAAGAVDRSRGLRLSELETSSLAAYQHYVRGIRLDLEGRPVEAAREIDAAVALDSGFVGALQHRLLAAIKGNDFATMERLTGTLDRQRARFTPFDRIVWETNQAIWRGEGERSEALVRDLIARYPRDPRARALAVDVYGIRGQWSRAEAMLLDALTLDSLGIEAGRGPCTPCLSYRHLVQIRLARGDWSGAERAARRWIVLQPEIPAAWHSLALTLAFTRRNDDAVGAIRRAVALSSDDPSMLAEMARILVMARDLETADSLVARWENGVDRELRRSAHDLRVMIDRERGRHRAAIRAAEQAVAGDAHLAYLDLIRLNSLARLGEHRVAERLHEQRIHGAPPRPVDPWPPKPGTARGFCWEHALLADAIAPVAANTRLAAIADSLEQGCGRSYYARDWVLHHYVRGLLLRRAGRIDDAITEFRRARHTVGEGWSRTAVEIADAQLASGRARDAIATLREAYATPLNAMGRYVPRSELDYHMARAFVAAGLSDSATWYANHVRRAWRDADPEVLRAFPFAALTTR